VEKENYIMSKHVEERYAERITNKAEVYDIRSYVAQNEDKIQADINKMIAYGELIYSGRRCGTGTNPNLVDVYRKDLWIILVDAADAVVITLYKVNLGCGNDFDLEYMDRMLKRLRVDKENVSSTQKSVSEESTTYKELLEQNVEQINEYRTYIKNLEELNKGYKTVLDNNNVRISQANRAVADTVNALICKKEF